MSDALRLRLAAIVNKHDWNDIQGNCHCGYGELWAYDYDAYHLHVSDAIISGLNIQEAPGVHWIIPMPEKMSNGNRHQVVS